jgi:hypothetical protein
MPNFILVIALVALIILTVYDIVMDIKEGLDERRNR